jgi:hypothetical protein
MRVGARWHWRCTTNSRVSRSIAMLCALVAHMGCYDPSLKNCTIECTSAGDCLGDQVCTSDGYCAATNVLRCDGSGQAITVDAAPPADGTPIEPDARDLCSQGCPNGTCIAGVCTIDCSQAGSCENDVVCPANLPCHVICGDSSCGHHVNCTMASSCDVECTGEDACNDEIQCPAGRACDVTCSGDGSCKRRTKCDNSCSCDVTCSGVGSCAEASECPDDVCRVGNACSSLPPGCDTCP